MQTKPTPAGALLAFCFMLVVPVLAAQPQTPARTEPGSPAINGYSPVSYFTEGRPERGDPAFAVRHDERTWFFTSEAQRDLFRADPEKYLPRYAELCPYNLVLGRTQPIDPTRFRIVGGQLLLFHSSEGTDGLELWKKSPLSEAELMRRADARFELLSF